MIQIKSIRQRALFEVTPDTGSVHKFQLMSEDYLSVKFTVQEPIYLGIGDSVEYENSKYYLTDRVYPTYNSANAGYEYNLKLESHYFLWRNHILFYDRQGNKEAAWSLTRAPEAHMSVVISNVNALGFNYNGKPYQAVVGSEVAPGPIYIKYDSTNIIDGLTQIAEACNCEWWVIEDKVYLGKLEYGEPIKLEIGVEAQTMSRTRSQDFYATRLYVFGSTRNIPADYRADTTGNVIGGIVEKRLMLPEGTPYIDVVEGLQEEEIIEAVVVIDEVYPRRVGTITEVIEKEVTETPEGSDVPVTTKYYRFKDADFEFSESYALPEQNLKMRFQSGPLAGLDFEVKFNPDELEEDNPEAQVFEIVRNEDYGQPLPQYPLIPGVGNTYVLYNFNPQFVSDNLIPLAEEELLQEGLKVADEIVSDPSTYNCVLDSYKASGYEEYTEIFNPEKKIDLQPGQKVELVNPAYFETSRITRVLGYEKKLDKPYDSPSYTIGESASYSRLNALEKQINNIKVGDVVYVNQGGGGSLGVYVIKKDDSTAASDENVFSALRTLSEILKAQQDINKKYLRKDIDDVASGNILFKKKIGSFEYIPGWEGKGWEIQDGIAELEGGRFRDNALFKKRAGGHVFTSGFPNGIGWDIAPYKRVNSAGVEETKYRLEIDDVNVRGKLRAYEFVISQLRGENDNVIFAGMMKVEYYDEATGRIYLDTDKGVLFNPFRPGDIIMVQHYGGEPSADNDYNLIKQYEFRVAQVGIGSLTDKENRLDWLTFTNFVGEISDIAQGDVLTRVDSVSDSTRKGVVRIQTIDEIGAPYIDVVYGMKTDPTNATKVRIGNLSGIRTKNGVDLTGVWGMYGNGLYLENTTHILDTGNTIEQEFSIMNGKFESKIEAIRNDISLEPGNILTNSSFSQNLDYWESTINVRFLSVMSQFIYSDAFVSEKANTADIYKDGNRYVLRIRAAGIYQDNAVMNKPEITEPQPYSFSFYYKVITPGTLNVGFQGKELFASQSMQPTDNYAKFSKKGNWDGEGDFVIQYSGEILIYSVSLFESGLADAVARLETKIEQTEESIKLLASKEYVDKETGEIYKKYDSELSVTAGQISGISSKVDNIENTIETSGWITKAEGTTIFAKKEMENGSAIVNAINVGTGGIKISANRLDISGITYFSLSSSLQNMIDGKADTSDLGDLAYNDSISKSDLAYSLAQEITNKADSSDLGSLSSLDKITEAMLEQWGTIIAGGYIKTSLINAAEIQVTNLNATKGKIAGFSIYSNMLENTNFGTKIRIADSSNNKYISIGGSGDTCISISSYGSGNIGLYVLANAGSRYAIEAYGSMVFGQRSSESWNAPGVLCCYSVSASGSISKIWGNGASISAVTDQGNGQYIVRHNVGHTSFSVLGIINGTSYMGYMRINSLGSSLITIEWRNQNGDTIRPNFHLFLIGRNTW